ncbi:MAG: class I SAM-dependent methyltransferase [Dehalococcoidia bacterium]
MNQAQHDPAALVRRQFGAVATAYASSAVHASGPDLSALVDAARLTGGEEVLDLGCGAGHTALALAPTAARVTAVDVTPEMLSVASELSRERGISNISFRHADVASLPFANGSFDLVTSRYSAHHYVDPEGALAEAARVLHPGGRILLVDSVAPEEPALDTLFNAIELLRDSSHVRNCRISEWSRLFATAGFEVSVLFQMDLDLDGESWVQRSQTPAPNVSAIKLLFDTAQPTAREAFDLHTAEPWGWRIPVALLQGQLPS